jgi:hypothetical protein
MRGLLVGSLATAKEIEMQDFEQQMADHNDAESRRQKGASKDGAKGRDLSKYTPPHLKKMKAAAEALIEQIDAELQEREDNGDGLEAPKMNAQQFESWSRKQIDKADRQ